jgi:hypothetical protein
VGKAFHIVMKVVSTLLGVLMVCMGGIWVLQGLNIAFLDSFMAGDPQWAVYGAILVAVGVGQVAWSITRAAPARVAPADEPPAHSSK